VPLWSDLRTVLQADLCSTSTLPLSKAHRKEHLEVRAGWSRSPRCARTGSSSGRRDQATRFEPALSSAPWRAFRAGEELCHRKPTRSTNWCACRSSRRRLASTLSEQHYVRETDGLVRARTHADDVARIAVQLKRELARHLLRCLHLPRRISPALREPLVNTRRTMRASEGHG
jgi:hypothetical protein